MKKIKPAFITVFAILIWAFICTIIYIFVRTASSGEIIWWIIFYGVIIIFAILMMRFPALKRFFDFAFEGYLLYSLLFILPYLPFYFFYKTLQYLPVWLQVLIFILWGMGLFAAIWALILEKNRVRLFNWLRKWIGNYAPLVYSFDLMWIGIFFFSSLTYILVQNGNLLWVVPSSLNITPEKLTDFYFWHFLDAVPVFKITDTLLWKEPLIYDSSWIGLLLLFFKIIVISPIVGAFIWYWRFIGQANKEDNAKVQVRKRVPRTYHRKTGPSR
jgi:hypothetical protein